MKPRSAASEALHVTPDPDSLHMIDGAKTEIEGVNHDIDGGKCQVVEYFVV